jgi:hypothetical protein
MRTVYHACLRCPIDETGERADTDLELDDPCGENKKTVINEAKDILYAQGYNRVLLKMGRTQWECALRSTPKREAMRANADLAAIEKEKQETLARHHRRNGLRRARRWRVVASAMADPSPSSIQCFFAKWKELTGHRHKANDPYVLAILAEGKTTLMNHLVALAKRNGWEYGATYDGGTGAFSDILYVDTPLGQASFHFRSYGSETLTLAKIPRYRGRWSGLSNTTEILIKLFEPGVIEGCERPV